MNVMGKKHGFTMVEVLVALLAGMVLAMTVGATIVFAYTAWAKNYESVKIQDDGSVAMIVLGREIRESGINDILIDGVSFAENPRASGSRLNFSTNMVRSASSQIVVSGDQLIYQPSDFVLVEDWLAGFTAQFNPNGPHVDITLHLRSGPRANESILSDSFAPRN